MMSKSLRHWLPTRLASEESRSLASSFPPGWMAIWGGGRGGGAVCAGMVGFNSSPRASKPATHDGQTCSSTIKAKSQQREWGSTAGKTARVMSRSVCIVKSDWKGLESHWRGRAQQCWPFKLFNNKTLRRYNKVLEFYKCPSWGHSMQISEEFTRQFGEYHQKKLELDCDTWSQKHHS